MFVLSQELPKKSDEDLKQPFFDKYKFFIHDINKFDLLLRKGI